MTSRAEYRNAVEENTILAELGTVHKLDRDYSALLRGRFYDSDLGAGAGRTTSSAMAGLAYRPVEYDRLNALAKFEFKRDKNRGSDIDWKTDSYIGSIEGVRQASRRLQVMAKYAGKLAVEDDFSAYTDLVAGRILYDLTSRFDLGAEYRVLHSYEADSLTHGGSIEAGCRVVKNLWLSVGYRFDEFDPDLSGGSYRGKGVYVTLRLKFDEKTLKNVRNRARRR